MSDELGPHPPPDDLTRRDLPIQVVDRLWVRFHRAWQSALYWGTSPPRGRPGRFDAPAGSYGTLYVAADEDGAFIETFGYNTGVRLVPSEQLTAVDVSIVRAGRPLRLVQLTGQGLARLGADARLFAADFGPARAWSKALHDHPSAPDGILYASRHDETQICAVLFDRVSPIVTSERRGNLADPGQAQLVASLLDRYGFQLI